LPRWEIGLDEGFYYERHELMKTSHGGTEARREKKTMHGGIKKTTHRDAEAFLYLFTISFLNSLKCTPFATFSNVLNDIDSLSLNISFH